MKTTLMEKADEKGRAMVISLVVPARPANPMLVVTVEGRDGLVASGPPHAVGGGPKGTSGYRNQPAGDWVSIGWSSEVVLGVEEAAPLFAAYEAAMEARSRPGPAATVPAGFEVATLIGSEADGAIPVYRTDSGRILRSIPEGSARIDDARIAVPAGSGEAPEPARPATSGVSPDPLSPAIRGLVTRYRSAEAAHEAGDWAACFALKAAGF